MSNKKKHLVFLTKQLFFLKPLGAPQLLCWGSSSLACCPVPDFGAHFALQMSAETSSRQLSILLCGWNP